MDICGRVAHVLNVLRATHDLVVIGPTQRPCVGRNLVREETPAFLLSPVSPATARRRRSSMTATRFLTETAPRSSTCPTMHLFGLVWLRYSPFGP